MIAQLKPAGEHFYVNGKEVSASLLETYRETYELIQEAPSYFILGKKKIVNVGKIELEPLPKNLEPSETKEV